MNDKEVRTQIGLYDIPRNADHPDDKVVNLFTKLKRKAKEIASHSSARVEPNVEELRHSAMNSYRLQDEVIKSDIGFEVG